MCRTEGYGTATLLFRGEKTWQLLPQAIKNAESLSSFKNQVKKWTPVGCTCKLCKNLYKQLGLHLIFSYASFFSLINDFISFFYHFLLLFYIFYIILFLFIYTNIWFKILEQVFFIFFIFFYRLLVCWTYGFYHCLLVCLAVWFLPSSASLLDRLIFIFSFIDFTILTVGLN